MKLAHRTLVVLTSVLLIAAPAPKPPQWPVYRGDAVRSNRGEGGPPVLQALWRHSMFYWEAKHFSDGEQSTAPAKERIGQAEKKLRQKQQPIIPAFSPIALTAANHKGEKQPLFIYKNFYGVMAVDRNNGNLLWMSPSNWSLQRMLASRGSRAAAVSDWLDDYEKHYPQIVFENSTIGTLSTDGQFVYVVEDLAVPPRNVRIEDNKIRGRGASNPFMFGKDWFDNSPVYDAEIGDAILHNRLYALLADGGKSTWALGDDEKDPLHDCYFLGPPLPVEGLLYVLIQKKKQMFLLCIDPQTGKQQPCQPKIVFQKQLGDTATPLIEDPIRRTQAAHLAYGEGVLVCPTNAGKVFGVDRRTQRIAWVRPYREKDEKKKDGPASAAVKPNHWKVTAPVIAGGKVVFTAPDDPSIYCLNLTDGSLLWSRKKSSDDVYLGGVYGGKVLIVGTKSVCALNPANGETLWTRETGIPSGEGIAADNLYYLPLQRGTPSKQPEICVLDLNTGKVIAHHQTRPRTPNGDDFDVPGNLMLIDGKLISQSPWEIVAYPLTGGK